MEKRRTVFILESYWDCRQIEGVYDTLELAKIAADEDSEHKLEWSIMHNGDYTESNEVEIENYAEMLKYRIWERALYE